MFEAIKAKQLTLPLEFLLIRDRKILKWQRIGIYLRTRSYYRKAKCCLA